MKVKDLIEALKQFDQELPVLVIDDYYGTGEVPEVQLGLFAPSTLGDDAMTPVIDNYPGPDAIRAVEIRKSW